MNLRSADNSKSRFAAYVEGLVSVIGHADRAGPLRDYCLGLIMPCERKSVEPMAAVTAPDRTAAQHQSLLHFVGQSPWSDEKVLAKVGEMVLPAIESQGPIEAWIIDDTGFPKNGRTPDPAADLLNGRHQWVAEQHRPGNAEAELGAHLGVSGDAAGIVIRRPGNKSRAKNT
jgi:SRSO17 transposase